MQGYILDTNVLYYLSGVSKPISIDVPFLEEEVSKLVPLSISEFTLLELFTHHGYGSIQ